MAETTLSSDFRSQLFQSFLEKHSEATSFHSNGDGHFIVRAQRTDVSSGSPVFVNVVSKFIPDTTTTNGNPLHTILQNYEVTTQSDGSVRLNYTGDPVEMVIPIVTTITRIVVDFRITNSNNTVPINNTQDVTIIPVATFGVAIEFTEANGTLVINQLELELGN